MRAIALTPQARQFSYKVLIHPVSMILDVLANIDVGVLVDLNVNVLPRAMTAFEFAVPEPFEGFRC